MRDQKRFFNFVKKIQTFFDAEGLLEVHTPPAVLSPGLEPHLHPFKLHGMGPSYQNQELYLHSSPEFVMKELLSQGLEHIYTLTYAFRNEPQSEFHRFQFLMLEWYRSHVGYEKIQEDCQNLIQVLLNKKIKFLYKTVAELFWEYCQIDLYNCHLAEEMKNKFPDIAPCEELSWDDTFYLIFLNKIEPHFHNIPYLIVDKYPASQAALAKIDETDSNVAKRFELYIHGVEIANCFEELTDLKEQQERALVDLTLKQKLYNYSVPAPQVLFTALKRGLPPCAGIALGVERLYGALTGGPLFP